MIQVENVHLRYQNSEKEILKGISFSIKKGTITGLIGHNGAGKTTLIKVICGLLTPQKYNRVDVNGKAVFKEKKLHDIGLILGENQLYNDLTAYENIIYYLKLNHVKKNKEQIVEMVDKVGLSEDINKLVRNYSTGMKQKLNIAKVLLCDKKIIILDEPTAGMDPIAKNEINQLLFSVTRNNEITILISSHAMKEVEKICDHVMLLNKGEILYSDRIENIMKEYETKVKEIYLMKENDDELYKKLKKNKIPFYKTIHNDIIRIVIMSSIDLIDIDEKQCQKVIFRDLELEDIFFYKVLGE